MVAKAPTKKKKVLHYVAKKACTINMPTSKGKVLAKYVQKGDILKDVPENSRVHFEAKYKRTPPVAKQAKRVNSPVPLSEAKLLFS